MWHVTYETWHMTGEGGEVNLLSKCKLPSSYGLGVQVCWRYFYNGSLTDLINQLISKVAKLPATPGLLTIWGSSVDNRPSTN